jgi:hypothetical protein
VSATVSTSGDFASGWLAANAAVALLRGSGSGGPAPPRGDVVSPATRGVHASLIRAAKTALHAWEHWLEGQ